MLICGLSLRSQDFHFGIRGGMNFSKFNSPVNPYVVEKYNFNNGFHFGLEATYSLNKYFNLGSGLEYSQVGSSYKYSGPSYYIFFNSDNYLLKNDSVSYDINYANSYLYIPLNLQIKFLKKFELKFGGYLGFLISPIANGKMEFGNKFTQKLKYNYYSDQTPSTFQSYGTLYIKTYDEDGNTVIRTTNQISTGYYQYPANDYKTGNYFNTIDAGVNAGLNYFINKSLYIGANVQYGLTDITNNKLDKDLRHIVEDGDLYFNNNDKFIYSQDKDRNLNFQVSMGFRF